MIFVGDIALPYKNAVNLSVLPDNLIDKSWIGNLEGAIVQDSTKLKKRSIVYNDKEAIQGLLEEFNFSGFTLANNHIFDAGSYEETVDFLKKKKIAFCGIGKNIEEASKPLILKEKEQEIIILNFGWEVIQCEVTRGNTVGVNPLIKKHVLKVVEENLQRYPQAKIIPFMHWNYELETEPQPFERELAKTLIDIGVAGVIGCHSHRIGGFEVYKNKPIVYSLGNWMFKQNYFFNGRHKFPDFCNQELALEWDFRTDEIKFHFFDYDRINSESKYTHSEDASSKTMQNYTPFRDMDDIEYINWYKKNHYHKNKGLPVYKWEDNNLTVEIKNGINKMRDFFIKIILPVIK